MPYIEVVTSAPAPAAATLRDQLIETASSCLEKPVGIFAGSVSQTELTFKGSNEPAAILRVSTLPVGAEQIKQLVSALTDVAARELHIDPSRVWTLVEEVPTTRWAAGGVLVSDH